MEYLPQWVLYLIKQQSNGWNKVALITESGVRKMLSEGVIKEKGQFHIEKQQLMTPSAREFLNEKNISIVQEKKSLEKEEMKMEKPDEEEYETLFGAKIIGKPENMTHLRGNLLVFKDHPRITFRGAIDSLESEIILVQVVSEKEKLPTLTADLEEIIKFIRQMIRCEVSGEAMGEFRLQGLSPQELRVRSHHPSQYYGRKHFLPNISMGEMVALLNKLRTKTRETELAAYKAFKEEYEKDGHKDIIKGLNRLSSLFWIMMFRYLNKEYHTN